MKKAFIFLCAVLIYACKDSDLGFIDVNFSNPPIVKNLKVEPQKVNLDTIIIGSEKNPEDTLNITFKLTATVIDKDGQMDIAETLYQILNPLRGAILKSGKLNRVNDSTFYGEPNFKIKRKESGIYFVKVYSVDKSGISGNEVYFSFELYRGNRPPVISELNAPDTVFLQSQTVLIKMTIKATDPDGDNDIKTVQFNSFKPDGSPSSGNPFRMYDDGNASGISGDDKAGDGIYSIIIQLPPSTQKGRYRFEFQAIDRANETSNIITHFLTVL